MQKLIKIDDTYDDTITEINKLLQEGWEITQMCSFAEPVALAANRYDIVKGNYGALLLLKKEN